VRLSAESETGQFLDAGVLTPQTSGASHTEGKSSMTPQASTAEMPHTPAIVGPHPQTRKLHNRCPVLVVRG
jgi:hypothetical protein